MEKRGAGAMPGSLDSLSPRKTHDLRTRERFSGGDLGEIPVFWAFFIYLKGDLLSVAANLPFGASWIRRRFAFCYLGLLRQ